MDDLIAAMTPRTLVISVSHVRFDDGSLLDASRVAAACHACAGYKWLLSPWGTECFWAKSEHLDTARPGPFYWMAQGTDSFSALNFVDPTPSRGVHRWDAAEASTYLNFNLTAMDASVDFVLRVGPDLVLRHNR